MAPLTLSGFAAIRSRRDPIVRIAHLVREIKFCDRQIGRLNATSALRHGHIAPVLTGSPPPVQVLFADALVRDGFAGVANLTSKAAQLLGDQRAERASTHVGRCQSATSVGPWRGHRTERRISKQTAPDRSPSAVARRLASAATKD